MNCQPYSIDMSWGADTDAVQITLIDSQGATGGGPAKLEMARTLPLKAALANITMTEAVPQTALSEPALLAEFGGPDYLSIVKEAPGGLKYAMAVSPRDEGGLAGAIAGHVRERYALTINMTNREIVGAAAGEAAYGPWLSALRLHALP